MPGADQEDEQDAAALEAAVFPGGRDRLRRKQSPKGPLSTFSAGRRSGNTPAAAPTSTKTPQSKAISRKATPLPQPPTAEPLTGRYGRAYDLALDEAAGLEEVVGALG